jgi:hypothetical protein
MRSHALKLSRRLAVTALAMFAIATAAHAAPIELIGTGALPATASDGLKLSPATLEDGTPHDRAGGFGSAIAYTGFGNVYAAVPDRGPADGTTSYLDRVYLLNISVTPGAPSPVSVTLVDAQLLRNESGVPFTGNAAAFDATNSPASLRLDPEGIRVSKGGSLFVSDEYGPFVYEFSAAGRRLRSLAVPAKFLIEHPSATDELPPSNTSGRQANRGMEGLAITPDGTKLYGIMQSPLIQDGALNSQNQRRGINNRILEIDLATGATREFLYQLSSRSNGVNEILAIDDHQFLVIERDGNAGADAAFKQIFRIDITGADDISGIASLPQTGLPDKPGAPAGTKVTPVSKSLFIDLLAPEFDIPRADFPEKIEGLAFGPRLPDGRILLLVTQDNDFIATQSSKIFAFAIEPDALPGFEPQTIDARLPFLEQARLWLGLRNSDDQGARFEVKVEVAKGAEVLAAGERHCVTGVTRDPNRAMEVTVPMDAIPQDAFASGDVLTITVSVRAGTREGGTSCGGHGSATGVRVYYDAASRPARVGEFYLHSGLPPSFDGTVPTAATPRFTDSAAVHVSGGNPWQVAGTWTMTAP